MNTAAQMVMIIMVVCCSACMSTTASQRPGQIITVPLTAESQNQGQIAQATLAPDGDETAISFIVSGVPIGTTRPVHLYTYIYPGSCKNSGTEPAYEMNEIVSTNRLASVRVWTFNRKAPVALSKLLSGDYTLVVRTSPADGNLDIFCGDISWRMTQWPWQEGRAASVSHSHAR